MWLRRLISYSCLVGVLVLVGLAAGWYWRGGRMLAVQTGSMQPTFSPGDAVLVAPIQPAGLRPGMILSYHSLANAKQIVSHRLIKINQDGTLVTRGDNLLQADPAWPASRLVGRATLVAPGLGRLADSLHRPLVLMAVGYVMIIIILAIELNRYSIFKTAIRYNLRS